MSMGISFSIEEKRIGKLLRVGEIFDYNNQKYKVEKVGKPTCSKGEPKTDIYAKAINVNGEYIEFKISFKKKNADFIENKMNIDRAEQLFGSEWESIIIESTLSIKEKFMSRPLVFKERYGRTHEGSITLGWKFELLNKQSGDLSCKMNLSEEQVIDAYAGTNLTIKKRNSYVNGELIIDSGVASHILFHDDLETAQDVVDNLIPIRQYVDMHPNIYFACKALNYRTYRKKWDGNRPLSVYIDWSVENEKLVPNYVFNAPLIIKGNEVANNLIGCLRELNLKDTNDINEINILDNSHVYGL